MNKCPISCVICAYKESSFLEDCVKSLLAQTVRPVIQIITSTPNAFISAVADKYHIPVLVNQGEGSMKNNWNFAYETAQTPYVTICHQDDIYEKNYIEELLKHIQKDTRNEIILLHTRWKMIKDGKQQESRCSVVHALLNNIAKFFPASQWMRLRLLSFGNAIKTPSICYNKSRCGFPLFDSAYQFALDWDTFVRLAKKPGKFIYVDRLAFLYRVSGESESCVYTKNQQRSREDLAMFRSLWPKPIAWIISKIYKLAYSVYE